MNWITKTRHNPGWLHAFGAQDLAHRSSAERQVYSRTFGRHFENRAGAFLGTSFVTSTDVKSKKAEVNGRVQALQALIAQQTANIPPMTLAGWNGFLQGWNLFLSQPEGFWSAGTEMDHALDYERQVNSWQTQLQTLLAAVPAPGQITAPRGSGHRGHRPPPGQFPWLSDFPGGGRGGSPGFSGTPTWDDIQPYVIGGGALVGIVALASMVKSLRG